MGILELNMALEYAKQVYVRRDFMFIVSTLFKVFTGERKVPKAIQDPFTIHFPQPEIEKWIKEQYELQKKSEK